MAVQRDTPLRRWAVADPAAAADRRAEAVLRRVLADVRIDAASPAEAVAAVGRLAGVPIAVDPGAAADAAGLPARAAPDAPRPVRLRLRGVTVAEAIAAALGQPDLGSDAAPVVLVPRAGGLAVASAADARRRVVVRGYDVGDLLPPDGPGRMLYAGSALHAPQYAPPPPAEALEALGQLIDDDAGGLPDSPARAAAAAGRATASLLNPAPPFRHQTFGVRLFVVTPAVDQRRVENLLTELRRIGRPIYRPDP